MGAYGNSGIQAAASLQAAYIQTGCFTNGNVGVPAASCLTFVPGLTAAGACQFSRRTACGFRRCIPAAAGAGSCRIASRSDTYGRICIPPGTACLGGTAVSCRSSVRKDSRVGITYVHRILQKRAGYQRSQSFSGMNGTVIALKEKLKDISFV